MIQLDANTLGVHSEDQKKHQQMIACFQMGGELAGDLLPYMLHHRKVELNNVYRLSLNGNRQQQKRAKKLIDDDLRSITSSYNSLTNLLNKFIMGLGSSMYSDVRNREIEISDAIYEFTDKLFEVK